MKYFFSLPLNNSTTTKITTNDDGDENVFVNIVSTNEDFQPSFSSGQKKSMGLAFDPEEKQEKRANNWQRMVSGAVTGLACRTIVQPLDVIKIRFQLQIEPITKSSNVSKYTGISHTVGVMLREEGVRAFWKGLLASQFISVVYTPIQFTSFYFLTEQSSRHLSLSPSHPGIHMICGSLAGVAGIVAAHPFDTVRTRLVGQGEPKLYKGQIDAIRSIFKYEGVYGFYRGLLPNVALVGPQAGATFVSYEAFKKVWTSFFNKNNNNSSSGDINSQQKSNQKTSVLCNLTAGAFSGIFSKSLIYPLDSIKKRLQVQGFEEARNKFGSTREYRGMIDCTLKIIREETFLGLYKGYLPSIYKAAAVTALNFAFFEYFVDKFK